ncbi:EthD family reductase [Nocardioides terrisoli]|uniref:EthD family reductase n=1 Tax=Nocardioides terrisoli TaxID=3388267 RepID=UPI00287B9FCF|nr:EthD family reductase [Nocardioides marmorisolisilvae]
MAQLIVLYGHPTDPSAFDDHYTGHHVPLAKTVPGCRAMSWGHLTTLDGSRPDYYLSAVLTFDSVESLKRSLATPEGQAVAADVGTFATGGATVLVQED